LLTASVGFVVYSHHYDSVVITYMTSLISSSLQEKINPYCSIKLQKNTLVQHFKPHHTVSSKRYKFCGPETVKMLGAQCSGLEALLTCTISNYTWMNILSQSNYMQKS